MIWDWLIGLIVLSLSRRGMLQLKLSIRVVDAASLRPHPASYEYAVPY